MMKTYFHNTVSKKKKYSKEQGKVPWKKFL